MSRIASDKKNSLASASLIKLEDKTKWPENKEKANKEKIKEVTENIDPRVNVVRAIVTYVDANLAYQFADALEDSNIMLSFATGFLGATVSFLIAFITSQTSSQSILFGTSSVFCFLLTIIFVLLTFRSMSKVKKTKKRLKGL